MAVSSLDTFVETDGNVLRVEDSVATEVTLFGFVNPDATGKQDKLEPELPGALSWHLIQLLMSVESACLELSC